MIAIPAWAVVSLVVALLLFAAAVLYAQARPRRALWQTAPGDTPAPLTEAQKAVRAMLAERDAELLRESGYGESSAGPSPGLDRRAQMEGWASAIGQAERSVESALRREASRGDGKLGPGVTTKGRA